jgi:hypothetical protein
MTLLVLFAMLGCSWIAKESELFASTRNWLMRHSPFMIRLLSCWWCVGFWAGIFVYLLHSGSTTTFETFNTFEWILWGFASSAVSALGNAVYERLTLIEVKPEETN